MSDATVEHPKVSRGIEKELSRFRAWFSLITFLLCAVAFAIGFPALEDAGKRIGLGGLAFGLPFAIDLGMVTLLLWSMWNRGTLKRWWPPLIPAGALLLLSSWLQYIHAVELIGPETPELARWGLLILASALPLLLALSAGVFESVTFAPLIDRARRHSELLREEEAADDELRRAEVEERRKRAELEAELRRQRFEVESRTQLRLLEVESENAAKALRVAKAGSPKAPPAPKPPKQKPAVEQVSQPASPAPADQPLATVEPKEPISSPSAAPVSNDAEALAAAIAAVRSGEMSQRAACDAFGVTRSTLRRRLEDTDA